MELFCSTIACKYCIVTLPQIQCGRSRSTCTLFVYIIYYVQFLVCCSICTNVHSTWTTLVYKLLQCSTASIGDPKVPLFYAALLGILDLDSKPGTRARDPVFGPRVHFVNLLYIFTHDHLWLVILKSQSRRPPAFMYHITCTCIFLMLFRSTCSWLFSVDNPLRVATEALNIHLVSCNLLNIFRH